MTAVAAGILLAACKKEEPQSLPVERRAIVTAQTTGTVLGTYMEMSRGVRERLLRKQATPVTIDDILTDYRGKSGVGAGFSRHSCHTFAGSRRHRRNTP